MGEAPLISVAHGREETEVPSRESAQQEAAALLFPNIADIALPGLAFFGNIYTL